VAEEVSIEWQGKRFGPEFLNIELDESVSTPSEGATNWGR